MKRSASRLQWHQHVRRVFFRFFLNSGPFRDGCSTGPTPLPSSFVCVCFFSSTFALQSQQQQQQQQHSTIDRCDQFGGESEEIGSLGGQKRRKKEKKKGVITEYGLTHVWAARVARPVRLVECFAVLLRRFMECGGLTGFDSVSPRVFFF